MSTALDLALPSPVGNLEAYKQAVRSLPMLGADEERELAERYRREGDRNAAWRLVTSHLRFVVAIARGYRGYGLPQEDIIQEGNVGLMKAVKRFDPARGTRLAVFAAYWIRAEIHDFILRNWRLVKVATTKAQRKLFYNLRSAKKRLARLTREEAAGIAEALDVAPEDVAEMERRLCTRDAVYDEPEEPDGEAYRAPARYLADPRFDPEVEIAEREWREHAERRLREALEALDERGRDIVSRRWLDERKATLHELAAEYGVSAERIRQLEAKAIGRLRAAVAA